jgi:hypothetical protein
MVAVNGVLLMVWRGLTVTHYPSLWQNPRIKVPFAKMEGITKVSDPFFEWRPHDAIPSTTPSCETVKPAGGKPHCRACRRRASLTE